MELLFSDLVDRMRLVDTFNYDSDLAKDLGITPQALSNFKKKGKLPADLAIKFALKHKVSVDWLLTGEWDQKSALVVLRHRLVTGRRGISSSFYLDTPLQTNEQVRSFLTGEFVPDVDTLLLLSRRAGGVCSQETFLEVFKGKTPELPSSEVEVEGRDITLETSSEGGVPDEDVWRNTLEQTVAELKAIFSKFEGLVKEGKNPILYMESEELQIVADPYVWTKVKEIDKKLQKKYGADRQAKMLESLRKP